MAKFNKFVWPLYSKFREVTKALLAKGAEAWKKLGEGRVNFILLYVLPIASLSKTTEVANHEKFSITTHWKWIDTYIRLPLYCKYSDSRFLATFF
jgi:hypothetical protein